MTSVGSFERRRSDAISSTSEPYLKSVRPYPEAKSVSPVNITRSAAEYKHMLPGVWPGVDITSYSVAPRVSNNKCYTECERRTQMDQFKIGKFIAECRKKVNLTQMQLSEKLGITDKAISKWERGLAMPDS